MSRESLRRRAISRYVEFLRPGMSRRKHVPNWPPDAFAIAAFLLHRSGGYLLPSRRWPPAGGGNDRSGWVRKIESIGREWKSGWPGEAPTAVQEWWGVLRRQRNMPITEVKDSEEVSSALIQIVAAADEASAGFGFPHPHGAPRRGSGMYEQAALYLAGRGGIPEKSTLCKEIETVRVLPKAHVPQTGMSLRSLSHHLSLWTAEDVDATWATLPPSTRLRDRHSISLLLVPWPAEVRPTQFEVAATGDHNDLVMPRGYGFFSYESRSNAPKVRSRLLRLLDAATTHCGQIDGVVLPELAMSQAEYDLSWKSVRSRGACLIAGIHGRNSRGQPSNYVQVGVPLPEYGNVAVEWRQSKHHRWQLDRHQIVQYGLGGQLDPEQNWWESAAVDDRSVGFIAMLPWLSLCTLVCEDLARQDPVARLVRATGPNLVIALLMDGPQLPSRWPARYATVLADDPGCSVLTLTSLGMCQLSRPPGYAPLRTVAMWKDAHSADIVPIDLPQGADGLVLHLVRRFREEVTADGRSDGGWAGYPALAGVHPVKMKP